LFYINARFDLKNIYF